MNSAETARVESADAALPEVVAEAKAPTTSASKSERFAFIDGLRGVAALAVAISHLGTTLKVNTPFPIPNWVFYPVTYGHFGVDVFFIISGFVISFSLREHLITPRFFARFALRRSLRLDPPYWATMAGAIALVVLSNRMYPDRYLHVPAPQEVVAHLFYVQGVLGIENIVPPFWTLCLEMQFYLLLVVITGITQRLPQVKTALGDANRVVVFGGLAFASLYLWSDLRLERNPWVHHYLYVFFAGTLTLWAIQGRIKPWFLFVFLVGFLWKTYQTHAPEFAFAGFAATMVYAAGRFGKLSTWLGGRVAQYFGRISYSLYLVHVPIGNRFLNATERFGHMSYGLRLAVVALSLLVSIVAAQVLYMLVERPSVRFARRWRAVALG